MNEPEYTPRDGSDNAGCDYCGINDRAPGSQFCHVCRKQMEYTPAEMMRQVEKLLGIGLETAQLSDESKAWLESDEGKWHQSWQEKASTLPVESSEAAVCGVDTTGKPDATLESMPMGEWAFLDADEWLERREAFSNEGDLFNYDEGLDDGEAQ